MKKLISYILLSIFAYYIAGFFFSFLITRVNIRAQWMKQSGKYENYIVSKEYYKSNLLRQGKEIRINNKLYDIKKRTFKGNKIFLILKFDNKETNLYKNLAFYFKTKRNNTNNANELISKILKINFFYNDISFNLLCLKAELLFYNITLNTIKGLNLQIFQPPETL